MEKRYVAIMDFYIYSESDEDAIAQATKMAELLSEKDDNRCKIMQLVEQPFGTLTHRKIKI